jgi:hypothetical protein
LASLPLWQQLKHKECQPAAPSESGEKAAKNGSSLPLIAIFPTIYRLHGANH